MPDFSTLVRDLGAGQVAICVLFLGLIVYAFIKGGSGKGGNGSGGSSSGGSSTPPPSTPSGGSSTPSA